MSLELPEGWMVVPLEIVVDILDSMRIPVNNTERQARIAGKQENELFPYYGAMGEIGKIDSYLFDEELIALGEDGVPFLDASKPKAYLISGKSWVNNHAHVLRSNELSTNKFLLYFLNQLDYHDYVNGGTRLKLTQQNLRRIPVVISSLPEQKIIAEKLDSLLAQVESTKARLDRIPDVLKQFRQSVLTAAVSGELTEDWQNTNSNEGWATLKLEEVAEIKDPHPSHRTPKEVIGGVPYIGIGDLKIDGTIDFDSARKVSLDILKEHNDRYKIKEGDFVFGKIGTLGKATKLPIDIDYTLSANVILIQPILEKVIPTYLMHFLSSPDTMDKVAKQANSTSQAAFGIKKMRLFITSIPPLEEQEEIVRRVEELFGFADKVEAQVKTALESVNHLTQSILAQAFSGELTKEWREQNPDLISGENSAQALLERIKAERAKLNPAQQQSKARTKKAAKS